MKPGNETIAHNIRLLRRLEGGSQGDFGKKYGANQKTVWSYEAGNAKPKSNFLLRLSKGTGISPETLLNVKLKTDTSGKIVNLQGKDELARELRMELKKVMNNFSEALREFYNGVAHIYERLDGIDAKSAVNKKINSASKIGSKKAKK